MYKTSFYLEYPIKTGTWTIKVDGFVRIGLLQVIYGKLKSEI